MPHLQVKRERLRRIARARLWLLDVEVTVPTFDLTFLPAEFLELAITLLLVPGNFLARTIAELGSGFFAIAPDKPPFDEGGKFAVWAAAVFWLVVMIESLMLYHYAKATVAAVRDGCHGLWQAAARRLRRHRIMRTCQEDTASADGTAETTIVQELGELDQLAAAALRFAYTRDATGGTTAATLSSALKASKRDILKALQELEKLQFIDRQQNTSGGSATYRLTPTGGFYLKACEVRRKQGGTTVTVGTQAAQ